MSSVPKIEPANSKKMKAPRRLGILAYCFTNQEKLFQHVFCLSMKIFNCYGIEFPQQSRSVDWVAHHQIKRPDREPIRCNLSDNSTRLFVA